MRCRLLLSLSLFLASALPSQATPFFARTYHFNCVTCHSGYPRLNAFGLAFKANNFRIPGAEKTAPLAWQKTIPVAIQALPTSERFGPGTSKADFTDWQLLAGGLLTRQTAFYVHQSVWVDSRPVKFPSYEVWGQQVIWEREKIFLKVGQFELPYGYSPGANRSTVFGPLLFGIGLERNDVRLGSAMRGLQLSGFHPKWFRWYLADGAPSVLASGNTIGQREFFGEFRDLFVRVATPDLTRNAGLFAYFTNPTRSLTDVTTREHGQRYGLDGTLFWHGNQIQGMLVYGENSDPRGAGHKGTLRSGFVEIDRMLHPWIGLTGRWDIQSSDDGTGNRYADAKTVGLRLYPSQYVRLQAEYQWLDHNRYASALMAGFSF